MIIQNVLGHVMLAFNVLRAITRGTMKIVKSMNLVKPVHLGKIIYPVNVVQVHGDPPKG